MKRWGLGVAVVLALGLAGAPSDAREPTGPSGGVAAQTTKQAPAPTIVAGPSPAIKGEQIAVTGRIPAAKRREVVLQTRRNGEWRRLDAARSNATGAYRLLTRAAREERLTFRVVAPSLRRAGRPSRDYLTPLASVRVAPQVAAVTSEVVINEYGDAQTQIVAAVRPFRAGRPVRLEANFGGQTYSYLTQTAADGSVTTHRDVDPYASWQFRAVFLPHQGAEEIATELYTISPRPAGAWKEIRPGIATCGVRLDNTGWCWGHNEHGNVGDGTTVKRNSPVKLPGGWLTIGSYDSATCGIKLDDTGWCWGVNDVGQVGDGSRTDRLTPYLLPGSWARLESFNSTTCGIRTDDTGWCWGWAAPHGLASPGEPLIQLPGTWRSFSSGGLVTCGVRLDDTAWCWGNNDWGQVLPGSDEDWFDEPVQVPGSWREVNVAPHNFFSNESTCGVRTDGEGWCWGEMGVPTPDSTPLMDQVEGLWRTLDPRCGITTDDDAYCWDGTAMTFRSADVAEVSGDFARLCFLDTTGLSSCDLGDPPFRWKTVLSAAGLVCGIREDDTGWCWGSNEYGAVGDGLDESRVLPTPVP